MASTTTESHDRVSVTSQLEGLAALYRTLDTSQEDMLEFQTHTRLHEEPSDVLVHDVIEERLLRLGERAVHKTKAVEHARLCTDTETVRQSYVTRGSAEADRQAVRSQRQQPQTEYDDSDRGNYRVIQRRTRRRANNAYIRCH